MERLLERVAQWEAPHEAILATTYTFNAEFFVNTGVLLALAQLGTERPAASSLVRQRLGNPYVGVLQGDSSSGALVGWVERAVWDARRRGLLHAKCLVVAGRTQIRCLLTSANLTEPSWRSNQEIAAVLTCPRETGGGQTAEVVDVLRGLRSLGEQRGLGGWVAAVDRLLNNLPAPPGTTDVVWSGFGSLPSVLERLPHGEVITVTSPFWPNEAAAATHVVEMLAAVAPRLRLITRGSSDGALFDLPEAFVDAIRSKGTPAEVAVCSSIETIDGREVQRRLHGKQLTVQTPDGPLSYVGSANATVRGLALGKPPNVELGILAPVEPMVAELGFRQLDPGKRRDLQEEASEPAVAEVVSGLALLHADGLRLEVLVDDAGWTAVDVPVGGAPRALSHRQTTFDLDRQTYEQVATQPEILLHSQTRTGKLPVVLDDEAKRDVDVLTATTLDLDEFLNGFGHRLGPDESDDDEDADRTLDPPLQQPSAPRTAIMAVHRARSAIERLDAHERLLRTRLEEDAALPTALLELWLHGQAGVVQLARHVRRAALDRTPPMISAVAATFIICEVESTLERMADHFPSMAAPLRTATRIVVAERRATGAAISGTARRDIERLHRKARP